MINVKKVVQQFEESLSIASRRAATAQSFNGTLKVNANDLYVRSKDGQQALRDLEQLQRKRARVK